MAAGLPVVANPVGMNRRMVVHGRTGLLASTPQQWAEALARLAADPPLRRKMGEAGRRLVRQRYSVAGWGPKVADVAAAVVFGTEPGKKSAPADPAASSAAIRHLPRQSDEPALFVPQAASQLSGGERDL
jgi:hypothetical protein